ncbi:MAG: hypothetical protein J5I91_04220 [Bacteroidetes bacterium]|nr:hypothetical protein [Bacteroidota bacterium]
MTRMLNTHIFYIFLSLLNIQNLCGFGSLSFNTGRNQSSFGQYAKISTHGGQTYSNWEFKGGIGLIFSNADINSLDALKIQVSRKFETSKRPFIASVYYQWKPYSENIFVNDFGVILKRKYNKWDVNLGANSLFMRFPKARSNPGSPFRRTVWEAFNFMYKITYRQAINKHIDMTATLTDYDEYYITQETNPFIILGGEYKLKGNSKIFMDLAYQQAGLLNIRVNYYGYYIRLGYKFGLDLNS